MNPPVIIVFFFFGILLSNSCSAEHDYAKKNGRISDYDEIKSMSIEHRIDVNHYVKEQSINEGEVEFSHEDTDEMSFDQFVTYSSHQSVGAGQSYFFSSDENYSIDDIRERLKSINSIQRDVIKKNDVKRVQAIESVQQKTEDLVTIDETYSNLSRDGFKLEKVSNGFNPSVVSDVVLRKRRSLRPLKIIEYPETKHDFVIDLDTDYSERFAFKDPTQKLLQINPVMGSISLKPGERLDYETLKELEFTVGISRVDMPSCKS